MARTWSRVDLVGTRNGVNHTFTIPGLLAGSIPLVIFNSRILYQTASAVLAITEYNLVSNTVVLGLAPEATANLWAVFSGDVSLPEEPIDPDDLIVATAPPGAAVQRYLNEIRKSFYFNVHLLDTFGRLVEVWEKEVSAISWRYAAEGGCLEAHIELRRPFDDYGPVAEDFQIEIWRRPDPLAQAGAKLPAVLPFTLSGADAIAELRWSGFVREHEPALETDERVELRCAGWSRQLDYVSIANAAPPPVEVLYAGDVGEIVRNILDDYIVPKTQIKRTAAFALVPDTGIIVDQISFFGSAAEAIRTLANIAGAAEWGVRPDKEFYFLAPAQTVRQTHVIGKNVAAYRSRRSTDDIVHHVHVQGADGFTATIDLTALAAIAPGYRKERVVVVGAISTVTTAGLWAQGYAAKFAPEHVSPSGQLQLAATDEWLEQFGHLAGQALGLLRVIGGPVFVRAGDALPAELPFKLATIYGNYTDQSFRLHSITYTPRNEALVIDVDLGPRGNSLADLLSSIEFKLGELRQAQA